MGLTQLLAVEISISGLDKGGFGRTVRVSSQCDPTIVRPGREFDPPTPTPAMASQWLLLTHSSHLLEVAECLLLDLVAGQLERVGGDGDLEGVGEQEHPVSQVGGRLGARRVSSSLSVLQAETLD